MEKRVRRTVSSDQDVATHVQSGEQVSPLVESILDAKVQQERNSGDENWMQVERQGHLEPEVQCKIGPQVVCKQYLWQTQFNAEQESRVVHEQETGIGCQRYMQRLLL